MVVLILFRSVNNDRLCCLNESHCFTFLLVSLAKVTCVEIISHPHSKRLTLHVVQFTALKEEQKFAVQADSITPHFCVWRCTFSTAVQDMFKLKIDYLLRNMWLTEALFKRFEDICSYLIMFYLRNSALFPWKCIASKTSPVRRFKLVI